MHIFLIQIIGTILHFIFLISIYDIQRRNEVYIGTWRNCTTEPISKRLVLFIFEGLDANSSQTLSKDSFIRKKMEAGTWGMATGTDMMKISGLATIARGFEEQPSLLSKFYSGGTREWDNIFNHVKKTIYIGNNSSVCQYSKKSNDWMNINLGTNLAEKFLGPEKKNMLTLIEKSISGDPSIQDMQNCLILTYITDKIINTEENKEVDYINLVDIIVEGISTTIDKCFNDNKTTYILSSDKVPVVGWKNRSESIFVMWGNDVKMKGNIIISMSDINVFVSTILGNLIPLSSVGQWHEGMFQMSSAAEAQAKACNSFHLASVASTALQQVGSKLLNNMGLSFSNEEDLLYIYESQLAIDLLTNNPKLILETSNKLIALSIQIIKKDTLLIRRVVNFLMHFMYVGWSLLLLTKIIQYPISRNILLKHEIKIMKRKTHIWFFGMNIIVITTGGLCALFVLLQGWPFYYIIYIIPTIFLWGYVLNYIEYWIAFLVKMGLQKFIVILIYGIIFCGVVELYAWGISYNFVVMANVLLVSMITTIFSYWKKENIGIQITTISTSLLLASSIFLQLNSQEVNLLFLVPSGMIWPLGGTLNAIYMSLSGEILDTSVMVISTIHYCYSYAVVILSSFYKLGALIVLYLIQLATGPVVSLVGKPIVPSTEVPHDTSRYNKSNRLHHIGMCLSSVTILLSVSFEPLFAYVLYVFLIMWYFIMVPPIKIETINRENAHIALTFAMVVILIQHVCDLRRPPNSLPYLIQEVLPRHVITSYVVENMKIYLMVAIAQSIFTSITLSSGGDALILLATLILNLCGYRLFAEFTSCNESELMNQKIQAHTSLQFIMIAIFLTLSLYKVLLKMNIWKAVESGRNLFQAMTNRQQRDRNQEQE